MDSEVIDLSSLDDSMPGMSKGKGTTNFGGGIELLMNEKTDPSKSGSGDDGIKLNDLEELENELNEITGSSDEPAISKSSIFTDPIPNLNDIDENVDDLPPISVKFDDNDNLGKNTSSVPENNGTWDGFNKFNEIPVTPDISEAPKQAQTKEELLREKFQLLRKLEALEIKGVQLSKKYTMESPILEMKGEYETIMDEKAKQNSIKFSGNMLMTCINGLEFLNNRFDPFDLKLDGWSEQVGENIDDYDEVFGELYDKYKSKATMAPELKLLFQLGGSAAMLHMTNTMFKSAMPGMDDILRQNPELAQQFQKAAVNSMSNNTPGFSGFMNSMSNDDPMPPMGSGPPPPMRTQGPGSAPPPDSRPGNDNSFSARAKARRGVADDGINISENFASASDPPKSSRRPNVPIPPPVVEQRAEMKGPSDIDSILSGLKTKKVSMGGGPPPSINENMEESFNNNESSTISIQDLKDLQSTANVPKKSRRRRTSDKNTVSLDI
jgi:hypothetical protein